MRLAAVLLTLILAGCFEPTQGPPAAADPAVALAAHFAPAGDVTQALLVRSDASALRWTARPTDSATLELPDAPQAASDEVVATWRHTNANRSAGVRIESLESGRVGAESVAAIQRALTLWRPGCPECEGETESFVRFLPVGAESANGPAAADLVELRDAFAQAEASFVAESTHLLTTPATPRPAEPPCLQLDIVLDERVVRVGDPVRFDVVLTNCAEEAVAPDPATCFRETAGLVVFVEPGDGHNAKLYPSTAPTPASADWTACTGGAQGEPLAPGDARRWSYAWDGRIVDICKPRTSMSPPTPCDGEIAPRAGAQNLRASFSWAGDSQFASRVLVVVDDTTRRMPVILVTENYTKSRVSVEIPAHGEGCPDFALTRDPWSATGLSPASAYAAAVLVRTFPQGGYGTFGPDALALPREGALEVRSVFDPDLTLFTIVWNGTGFLLDGRPLSEAPTSVHKEYDATWEGERFRITEDIEARIAADAYVFSAARTMC